MRKLNLVLISCVFAFSGCFGSGSDSEPESPVPMGGDQDEHGCLIGAGYSWCEQKQKCLRVWEEPCEDNSEKKTGEVQCETDSDCVPDPCDCHPHQCLSSEEAMALDCTKPEMCTMLFDCEAAYSAEDCLCQDGKCTNGNEGKICN